MRRLIKSCLALLGLRLSRAPNKGGPVYWPESGRSPETEFERDRAFHEQYGLAQQRTQMLKSDNALRRNRHYFLYQLIRQASLQDGHVVELGCWRGLSAYQIASYLDRNRRAFGQRKFFIFDSFAGLSEIQDVDRPLGRGGSDDQRLRAHFRASRDEVAANLAEFADLTVFLPGWIPERFHEVAGEVFSFVHVDVDLYEPVKASIAFFYPRLCKHGIMVLDDYGCTQFPGAKRAVDEFLADARLAHGRDCIFVATPTGSAFLIKLTGTQAAERWATPSQASQASQARPSAH